MDGLLEQNQINGLIPRLEAIEAGSGVSGGTGLLEPLTPAVSELTEIYTRYTFDKISLNYLYQNNPVVLTVPTYLDSIGKPALEQSRFDLFYIALLTNTLTILPGTEAETPVLPGTPANGLFVGFGLVRGDGSYEVGASGTEDVIYVGKGGDNAKDGRSPENRVLTFARAMEIKVLNPDFSIFCKDAGFYNENLTIDLDSYSLEIFAPNASFAGTWVCTGDGQFTFNAKKHFGSISMTNEGVLVLNEGIYIEQITLNLTSALKCGYANINKLYANNSASIFCSHIRGTLYYSDIETLTIKGRINDDQYPDPTLYETTQAAIENNASTESDKFVSVRRFWQGISKAWTLVGIIFSNLVTFSLGIKSKLTQVITDSSNAWGLYRANGTTQDFVYNSLTGSMGFNNDFQQILGKYFYTCASLTADTLNDYREYVSAGVKYYQYCSTAGAQKGAGGWTTLATFTFSTKITNFYSLKITDQEGIGTRVVQVDLNGNQFATLSTYNKRITDANTIALLVNPLNWDNANGTYTGTTLDPTYAFVGAIYDLNIDYKYEIDGNGNAYRLLKG